MVEKDEVTVLVPLWGNHSEARGRELKAGRTFHIVQIDLKALRTSFSLSLREEPRSVCIKSILFPSFKEFSLSVSFHRYSFSGSTLACTRQNSDAFQADGSDMLLTLFSKWAKESSMFSILYYGCEFCI
jgi:hypothetical protein